MRIRLRRNGSTINPIGSMYVGLAGPDGGGVNIFEVYRNIQSTGINV